MKSLKLHRIARLLSVFFLAALLSCSHESTKPRTWTVLVYMAADDSGLSQGALVDLAEMQSVGSTDRVSIIVQLDLPGGVAAGRYRVHRGSLEQLANLGEVDMADPRTLTDFLVWAKRSFPADRTALILGGHGNGWDQGDGPSSPAPASGRERRPSAGPALRSLLLDQDPSGVFLSNHRIRQAISDAGIGLELLGLDACTMGTLEALYEFRDLAPVIVSSQEDEGENGWDYGTVLSALTENPDMSGEILGGIAVNSYRDFLENSYYPAHPGFERRYTMAALRTEVLDALASEVDGLARDLMLQLQDAAARPAALALIGAARASVQEIDGYIKPYVYVDLADLDRLLNRNRAIAGLMSRAVIAEYHGAARPGAHGISLVFFRLPEARQYGTFDPDYCNYDPQANRGNSGEFINRFRWDEFLAVYYAAAGS